jgi:peptidoglycan/xylan/chitin deacetylase (PgdA/CDA1 family)
MTHEPAATVCLTFDVDAEAPWRYRFGQPDREQLGELSAGRYGIVRGLPRILELLARVEAHGTFFVPGATVDAHPEAIRRIHDLGHEIAHHGYHHYAPHRIPLDEQRRELERGSDAIEACTGRRPVGYRSPSWELTAQTFALLTELGLRYDSSLMGDDRPYLEGAGPERMIELPVHWSLDDFRVFAAVSDFTSPMCDPRAVFELWWTEVESAIEEGRATVLTFHPEVIGRAWTFGPFARFVERLAADPRVRLSRCVDVAARHAPLLTGAGTAAQELPAGSS